MLAQHQNEPKDGEIKILGDKVGLFDEAVVDASGAVGGGEVLIGGDQQGLNPDVKNATATYIGESTWKLRLMLQKMVMVVEL